MRWSFALAASLIGRVTAQQPFPVDLNSTFTTTGPRNVRIDSGTYGPPVEEVHYFYDQWPIGVTVSKTGRIFACYTRGTYAYTLGEIVNLTAEAPYPNLELNTPPDGLSTEFNGIPFGSNDHEHFISVQAIFVTPDDMLWVLDTGRPTINLSTSPVVPYSQPGGPKLVAINLTTDTIAKTYTMPADVHFPDSYMNDLRFDLRSNVTESGGGIAYIVDSSDEGREGFIVIDLGTGESWRHLTQHPSTLRASEDVPSYQGLPFYFRSGGKPISFLQEGLDGAELSLYGDVRKSESAQAVVPKEVLTCGRFCITHLWRRTICTQSRPSTYASILRRTRCHLRELSTTSRTSGNEVAMQMGSREIAWATCTC
jgi:hypothetical protein